MKQDMKEQLLIKRPIDLLFQLSIPAVIGMIVIGLYPLMDGIFAGNIIGQTAMTACGVAMPLTFFNSGVSTLLGVGSASVLSRAIGKGDQNTVDKIMGNLIFWVILFSAIITVGGILLAPHFLDMVGATGEIKAYGIRYLRVIFIGSLFVNFTQSANMVMRGEGLMKKAMMIMGLGALLNIILDPILMTVMGEYAIEGAALATITAQFVQAVVTLHYFLKKSKVVKIHKIKSDEAIKKEMFGVGSSAMMMQLLFMIQQTMASNEGIFYRRTCSCSSLLDSIIAVIKSDTFLIWSRSKYHNTGSWEFQTVLFRIYFIWSNGHEHYIFPIYWERKESGDYCYA